MGLLTFALNVTLDGCCDHREMIADDEMLDHFTQLIGAAGAMLYAGYRIPSTVGNGGPGRARR